MSRIDRKAKNYKVICPICQKSRMVIYIQYRNIITGKYRGCKSCASKEYNHYWKKGRTPWNKGLIGYNKGHRPYVKLIGSENPSWIDGRTPLSTAIRNSAEYQKWRKDVFERDNYTCQKCPQRGGELQVDHIRPFSYLFSDFLKEYDQFSPIEDKETLVRLAMKYKPFWDTSNGRTLCKDCHRETETFAGRLIKNG